MPRGYGQSFGKGLDFGRVDKPSKPRAAGLYRSPRDHDGRSGGANFPTVLESYEKNSDYKRWRAGWDYWQGGEKSWADFTRDYQVYLFRDFGSTSKFWKARATYFPSDSSPEATWIVGTRLRGSLILPQPLLASDITFDTVYANPARHRLILDVSSTLSAGQLKNWENLLGDQFEDSGEAVGAEVRAALDPLDTVAYTLVDVDQEEGRLSFDVSRPFVRFRPNPQKKQAYWRRLPYDGITPLGWRSDGSRFLCSSHRFFCSCPDFSGRRVADLLSGGSPDQVAFPRPGASRPISDPQESRDVGYLARFRTLADRSDQRRECKHIHAVRFSLGYPFYEPSDYPLNDPYGQFYRSTSKRLSTEEMFRYHRLRRLALDRLAIPLAEANGVRSTPGDVIGSDPDAPLQPGRPPVLWSSPGEPAAFRCQEDDWWVDRGTQVLRVFSGSVGRFVDQVAAGGVSVPVFREGEAT